MGARLSTPHQLCCHQEPVGDSGWRGRAQSAAVFLPSPPSPHQIDMPALSAAATVTPEPPKLRWTMSQRLLLLRCIHWWLARWEWRNELSLFLGRPFFCVNPTIYVNTEFLCSWSFKYGIAFIVYYIFSPYLTSNWVVAYLYSLLWKWKLQFLSENDAKDKYNKTS